MLTEGLWQEQTRLKMMEGEMYDTRLHCTGLSNEIVELKSLLEKERNNNTNVLDMTREELFKMKNR